MTKQEIMEGIAMRGLWSSGDKTYDIMLIDVLKWSMERQNRQAWSKQVNHTIEDRSTVVVDKSFLSGKDGDTDGF